jgi:hypothetical protein
MNRNIGHIPMAFTPTLLKLLPAWIAAMVRDYATGDPQQHWRLRDLDFDTQTLDPLHVGETSTCECHWTGGWFWLGRDGSLSLSPHLGQPATQRPEDEFAWIVERENESGHEHITVWRIRVLRPEVKDESGQAKVSPSAVAPQPVNEQQLFELADTFQRKHELERVLSIVEAAYGPSCGARRAVLEGGDPYHGGSTAYRHMDRILVFDMGEEALEPNFDLPFWQDQPSLDEMLAQPGDENYNDGIDGYDDPVEGSQEFLIAAALEDLIHKKFGFLADEQRLEVDLASEDAQALLRLQFPALFISASMPPRSGAEVS